MAQWLTWTSNFLALPITTIDGVNITMGLGIGVTLIVGTVSYLWNAFSSSRR